MKLKCQSFVLVLILTLLLNSLFVFADEPVEEPVPEVPPVEKTDEELADDEEPLDNEADREEDGAVQGEEEVGPNDAPANEENQDDLDTSDGVLNTADDEAEGLVEERSLAPRGLSTVIYLNGESGSDDNDGSSLDQAVKSFSKAKELATEHPTIKTILISGTVTVEGEISLAGLKVLVKRESKYKGNLFLVAKDHEALFSNIHIDGNKAEIRNVEGSLIRVEGKLQLKEGTILENNALFNSSGYSRGGAIYCYHGAIQMTGGLIQNNEAVHGAGISLNGATMDFEGGVIQNNWAQTSKNYASGGGVNVDDGSTLNLSGEAKILNNRADELGGGISLGTTEWSEGYRDNVLNMTGGVIDGNQCGAAGGGIFVQVGLSGHGKGVANISKGRITNNQMTGTGSTNKAFGGGAIYVNGGNDFEYDGHQYTVVAGVVNLQNALITENTATLQGAGIAACPISITKIYITDGAAIYRNQADLNNAKHKNSHDIYVLCNQNYYEYFSHAGTPTYYVSNTMLGGQAYNWNFADESQRELPTGTLENQEFLGLHTNETGNKLTEKLTQVVISGNYSATRGGGIGSNGTVIIGTEGEMIEIPVQKVWVDNEDKEGLRPSNTIIKLYANGHDLDMSLELNQENEWQGVFKNLPKTSNGVAIEYSVKEESIAGYTVSISGTIEDGFTVTNTKTPSETPTTSETVPTTTVTGPRPTITFTIPTEPTAPTVSKVDAAVQKSPVPATGESGAPFILGLSLLGFLFAAFLLRRAVH